VLEVIASHRLAKNVYWWGWSQVHKWRWHGWGDGDPDHVPHIDMGPVSIYNLKCRWFWSCAAVAIWPLRKLYHIFFVYTPKNRGIGL